MASSSPWAKRAGILRHWMENVGGNNMAEKFINALRQLKTHRQPLQPYWESEPESALSCDHSRIMLLAKAHI